MLKETDLLIVPKNSRSYDWRAKIQQHQEMLAALLAGILTVSGLLVSHITATNGWYIYLAAYLVGGYYQMKAGVIQTVTNRELNVELLMGLAAIGAACINHWLEGSVLIFIFALSGALETYATGKSSRAISSLMALQPETARLIVNNQETEIAVAQLKIGDVLHIKPGERIPADSQIILGETTVDESTMTGEADPVLRQVGDPIMAGTVNIDGNIHAAVIHRNEESMFSKIIELVQTAQTEKAPSQLFIERFEKVYVKIVIAMTGLMLFLPHIVLGWSWSDTIYRAMVMLVVASPCALVASTMPAVLSAIASGARNGILIKGGVHLEQLASLKALAFDKTGTLTEGKPLVDWALNVSGLTDEGFYPAVAAIEKNAAHPLGEALVTYVTHMFQHLPEPQKVRIKPGFGVSGVVAERTFVIGKADLFDQQEMRRFLEKFQKELPQNHTLVFVAIDGAIAGAFALKDQVRNSSVAAIRRLHHLGIQTIMLTGDNAKTAQLIQQETGVSSYIADCLPENKVDAIKQLAEQYGAVGMVGDGINDTPALAQSTVGIAMGSGNDAALATADIILMKNDLNRIADAVRLSKRMNRIVKVNIAFALSMIVFLMTVNLLQFISMPLGVIGHEGSTILVILNGLRMLRG